MKGDLEPKLRVAGCHLSGKIAPILVKTRTGVTGGHVTPVKEPLAGLVRKKMNTGSNYD
jgi:hypothetical protein